MRQAYDYWQDQPGSFLTRRSPLSRQHTRHRALPSWCVSPLRSCFLSQSSGPLLFHRSGRTVSRSPLRGPAVVLSGTSRDPETLSFEYVSHGISLCASPIGPAPLSQHPFTDRSSPRLTGYACATRINTSLSAALRRGTNSTPKLFLPPIR